MKLGVPEDVLQAGGLRPESFAEMLVDVFRIAHARAGVSDELPADHVYIAPVDGVAKHAFDGVAVQQLEEVGVFDFG